MAYVMLDGTRMYYEEYGSGQPLVFVHGATQDTLSWRDNVEYYGRRYKVYAVDLPGHGKSDLIDRRPCRTTDEFAAAIARFVRTLKIPQPIIVGHSMGAAIAMTTGLNYPKELRGVVAVDGGAAFLGPAGVNYKGNILADVEINPAHWLETTIYSVLGRNTSKERRNEMVFDCSRCSPYVQFSDLLTYTSFNLAARLHEVSLPTYYIIGEDDWSTSPQMCRDTSARLEALGVPTGVWELKGVGHIPHWEQPDVFNKALDEVLERFEARKA